MIEITATVLTTSAPQPVQVLVSGLVDGDEYTVVGETLSGRRWGVPGGTGVSPGGQLQLVDNRAPVNTPVTYVVTTFEDTVSSNEVQVEWAPETGSPDYLIQSLDGQIIVPVCDWNDNGLPRTHPSNSATFRIEGRSRPVVVLSTGSAGSTTAQMRLSREAGDELLRILDRGGAVVVRTNGDTRDMPPSDIAVILSPDDLLWSGGGGASNDRVWTLPFTWIDDPEPSVIPVVWDVDEVDSILSGLTVDEVDTLFSGMTVDEVDAYDWGNF